MGQWFGHSGDLGDVIYSLPTIRAAGGGTLYLYHIEGKTWHGMSARRADVLRPLLLQQPYIDAVEFCPHGHADHNLNGFRDHCRPGRNLADAHLATHGWGPEHRHAAWLTVDRAVADHPVVFARSQRLHNDAFPWRRVWEAYRGRAAFVGMADEHAAFCRDVGEVPHVETTDFLELGRILAGCELFVGNQSAPAAVAEGLKATVILEVCGWADNCRFARLGRIDATRDDFALPAVCRQSD